MKTISREEALEIISEGVKLLQSEPSVWGNGKMDGICYIFEKMELITHSEWSNFSNLIDQFKYY